MSQIFMSRVLFILCFSTSLLLFLPSSALPNYSAFGFHQALQSAPVARPLTQAVLTGIQQPARKINPEALKKYVGRYELEAGIIPISTLDVSLDSGELWVKPSTIKKRRLIHKARTTFLDEIEGTVYLFNKDEAGKIVSLTFDYEGGNYTAPRVALPPPSLKGNTTFRLKGHADASIVALAGSFNYWNQSEFIFGREGDEWVCRIDLEPGKHAYKFVVDGNWLLDPANPNTEDDDYGVKNSVIIVERKVNQD